MEIVYGGAKEGAFLTSHPTIKSIHLTGSSATYDAVVWGKQKKARHICAQNLSAHGPQTRKGGVENKRTIIRNAGHIVMPVISKVTSIPT